MPEERRPPLSRRDLLALIGTAAGGAAMYQAMTALGFAAESTYRGPIALEGDPRGASVLVLGAGLAGLVAAFELNKAGYRVQVLEHDKRLGGRCWTLRGGDVHAELGAPAQRCAFDQGLYFNPGPWRIPYHHRAVLDYCRRFGVALEPFIHVNHNAYIHAAGVLGGRPQRFRHVQADFHGFVAELLAKAVNRDRLDDALTREDREKLLESLKIWGALDDSYAYVKGEWSSERRGYARDPGAGTGGAPEPSDPIALSDLLRMGMWSSFGSRNEYDYQSPLFQPVGGMDMIVRGFAREVGHLVRTAANVIAIKQDGNRVTAVFEDTDHPGRLETAAADWCICTIPLPVLRRVEMDVSRAMRAAINAIPYNTSVKIGLQFKRRFWEEDEAIYGGITFTDLPIRQISYPSDGLHRGGKGVLLGGYAGGAAGAAFSSLSPAERIEQALTYGAMIHPQYREEFETGIAVAWSRTPGALGCFSLWSESSRQAHYRTLCAFEGRLLLAGEHTSYLNAWQEGAVLSALDAVTRLHRRVLAG